MKIEKKEIGGFKTKIVYLNNFVLGIAEDIGPRILYFAHNRNPEFNIFGIVPDFGVKTQEGFWKIYGGHRLWSSPEERPRSYSLDDKPVEIKINGNSVIIRGFPEKENSIQKEIEIKPFSKNYIQVIHKIKNIGRWEIKIGCWALSVMRQKGFAIVPLKPVKVDKEGLLPDRRISIWPYTNLTDKRLILKNNYLFVRQKTEINNPFKIGVMANPMWTAYLVNGVAFVKKFYSKKGDYPDFGCNVEVFTNSEILELETLGPLRTVAPSESITHVELWGIFDAEGLAPECNNIEESLEQAINYQE